MSQPINAVEINQSNGYTRNTTSQLREAIDFLLDKNSLLYYIMAWVKKVSTFLCEIRELKSKNNKIQNCGFKHNTAIEARDKIKKINATKKA